MPAVSSPMPTPQPAITAKTYLRVVFQRLKRKERGAKGAHPRHERCGQHPRSDRRLALLNFLATDDFRLAQPN